MAKKRRSGSERAFIAAERSALETLSMAKTLVSLRAQLKQLEKLRDRSNNLTNSVGADERRLVDAIAATKVKLAKQGISMPMLNNNDALQSKLTSVGEKRAFAAPKSGGVGVYG